MGQAVALKQGYRVNMRSVRKLDEQVRSQNSWGSWWSPSHSATAFGAMGVAYAADILGNASDKGLPGVAPVLQRLAPRIGGQTVGTPGEGWRTSRLTR